MLNFDFKLALFGQVYNNEGLLYTYPESVVKLRNSGGFPAWVNALPSDARFLRYLVSQGGECFSTKYCKEGVFYCYTKFNHLDSRNGAVSIMLHTNNFVVSDAKQLVVVLRNLMKYFLDKHTPLEIRSEEVENIVGEIKAVYPIKVLSSETKSLQCDAYRVYSINDDLLRYLNSVIQEEYTQYKWVHFISAEQRIPNINSDLYKELFSPIKKCYLIKNGDDVIYVTEGKLFTVKHKKSGCVPFEVKFEVGKPSPYVETDEFANIIRVKSVRELDIKFKKRVIFDLFDANTGASIKIAGQPICQSFEVEEDHQKIIRLIVKGYQTKDVVVDPAKLTLAETHIQERLQRLAPFPDEDKDDPEPYKDDKIEVSKMALIRNFIVLALIALIIGLVIGLVLHHFVFAPLELEDYKERIHKSYELEINSKNDTIKNLKNNIQHLKNKNNELDIKNKELDNKIKDLEKQSNNSSKTTTSGTSNNDKTNIADAEKFAKEYLDTKDEWSLTDMESYVSSKKSSAKKFVANTEEYKFLNLVLEAKNLNSILGKSNIANNATWKDCVNKIKTKKNKRVKDDKILKCFVDATKNKKIELKILSDKINPL